MFFEYILYFYIICFNIINVIRSVYLMKEYFMEPKQIVVIGGVAAGASFAARVRRLNEHARIILVERERTYLLPIVDCPITLVERFKHVVHCLCKHLRH